MKETRTLACALLWLRNHYEAGAHDQETMDMVINRIDRVLKYSHPTAEEMKEFRQTHVEQ